ncbi:MAG TPA: DUF456 domain-containing protein [Nocardioidaceae bacterium]|nr:DUF456 domain-containing protein [Nocardioidaceae bacterium]
MNGVELIAGLVILVGLVGIVVPILPGSLLIVGAVLVWAGYAGTGTAWAVFAAVTTLVMLGQVVKYVVPGRGLRNSGVTGRSIMVGGLLAIVGFFVVPVIGLVLGFILGVYLSELQRVGRDRAWPSTVAALKAVGLSVFVELVAGLLATGTWLVGAIVV